MVDVLAWIRGGAEPTTVIDSNFAPNRLETLRSRNSAAYKGIFNLLLHDQCLDFRTGVPIEVNNYFEELIDIHHIFPKAWCEASGIDQKMYDSIINKTALSFKTNRIIGGNPPSIYLQKLRDKEEISISRQKEILISHAIDVDTMQSDDFINFYQNRREALLRRIERATGKQIFRNNLSSDNNEPYENDIEFDDTLMTN